MNKLIERFIIILFLVTAIPAVAEENLPIYNEASEAWAAEDYASAAEKFEIIRDQNSEYSEKAAFAYALSQEKSGHLKRAEEGYRYFITNYKDSQYLKDAQLKLINVLFNNGEYARVNLFLHELNEAGYNLDEIRKKNELIILAYLSLMQYRNVELSMIEYIKEYQNTEIMPLYKLWLAWYYNELNNNKAEEIYLSIIKTGENPEVVKAAKVSLVRVLINNNSKVEATKYMLELMKSGYRYSNAELLWLAKYFGDIRELAAATEVLEVILEDPESNMYQAIALSDLAQIQTENRKLHDALSNFPLVRKALLHSDSSIGEIELLGMITDYSNAMALRKIGDITSAHAILSKLEPSIYDPLYYKILYEQGLVAYNMGDINEAAKKLMQVGILATDPDLAGRALLKCYDVCNDINNSKLMKVCLEELSGKNVGSYGVLYPNSPYAAQAQEILDNLKK